MAAGSTLHRIEPGAKVHLGKLPTDDASAAPGDKATTTAALDGLRTRLADLQEVLWAERRQRLLVVLQGLDTSGKGGIVSHVFRGVNPAGLRVTSFKAPTEDEQARDYLWRIHAHVPAAGELGIFDRSHYEDVLIARAEDLVPPATWKRRYAHINAFEELLVDEGTTIVKFLLHLSKDEQRRRLQARLDTPEKRWKFRQDDLRTRARWDDYEEAFEEALERTSTAHAPWHVVPADRKWYARWAVATVVVATLEGMGLRWPEPEDLSDVVIPD